MHIQSKKDYIEIWKGYNCDSFLTDTQTSLCGLMLAIAVHTFKRFWKTLLICLISLVILWVIYFALVNREPSLEQTSIAYEDTFFHQSLNGQYVLHHPKSLKKPSNLEEIREEQPIEIENDVKTFLNRLNQNQLFEKIPPSIKNIFKSHNSNDVKQSNVPSKMKIQKSETVVSNGIKIDKNESTEDKNLEKNQRTNHVSSTNQSKPDIQIKTQNQNKQFPNYYEDNLRANWTFNISKNYDQKFVHMWTEPIQVNISNPLAPGEYGTAYVPANDEKLIMDRLKGEYSFNAYASDKMSLHRSLPDYRFPECRSLVYPEKLPTTSVIIVVHNELWSTLFRTVWSIIDRSPRELIEEIILVDDASTWSHLQRPLDDYVSTISANIKIIRTKKREGLIRARLMGAKEAKGSILTFLDAHMECTQGWLQPILSRIASDRSVVAVPLIDGIVSGDMSYSASQTLEINHLRWHLIFTWAHVPKRELKRTNNDATAPIRIPTHVGCAFSIDREYFFEIGSYDAAMDIWGSENVELAFRVWLCGGALEVVPCSRVGHLYRISTYSFVGDSSTITNRNSKRLVEVWMDDFKDLFYAANPAVRNVFAGNLTERFELKKRLQRNKFRWYLENVYPESTWLKEYIMMGEMKNVKENRCLDIYTTAINGELKLYPCHGSGGNQFFAFAKSGQIVTAEEICVGVNNKTVILVKCEEDKMQLWDFNHTSQWIVHRESGLCVQNNQHDVILLGTCNSTDIGTRWNFRSTWLNENGLPNDKRLNRKNDSNNVLTRLENSLTPNHD